MSIKKQQGIRTGSVNEPGKTSKLVALHHSFVAQLVSRTNELDVYSEPPVFTESEKQALRRVKTRRQEKLKRATAVVEFLTD